MSAVRMYHFIVNNQMHNKAKCNVLSQILTHRLPVFIIFTTPGCDQLFSNGRKWKQAWRRLGSEVTLLEAMPDFLPEADRQIAQEAKKQFIRQGLNIKLHAILCSTDVKYVPF